MIEKTTVTMTRTTSSHKVNCDFTGYSVTSASSKVFFYKVNTSKGNSFCKRIDIVPLIVLKCELIYYGVQLPPDIKLAICTESCIFLH